MSQSLSETWTAQHQAKGAEKKETTIEKLNFNASRVAKRRCMIVI